MKPSRNDPIDPEDLCVFQNPGRWKEARVEIPMSWFLNQELEKSKRPFSTQSNTPNPGTGTRSWRDLAAAGFYSIVNSPGCRKI
jgi:hypothetical protein